MEVVSVIRILKITVCFEFRASNFGFSSKFSKALWLDYPMLIKPDCISCILKMAITAIRNLTSDEAVIQDLTVQILTIPSLRGLHWDLSSPEVIEQVMEKMIAAFQTPDPFPGLESGAKPGRSIPLPDLEKIGAGSRGSAPGGGKNGHHGECH